MRFPRWNLSIPVLFAFAHQFAIANDIEPDKEYYSAPQILTPIVLDGSLSEWAEAPVLAEPGFYIPKGSGSAGTLVLFEPYDGGTWSGPDDQASTVQIAWDENNVYFGFVVTDDYHENMSGSAWNGDSIQLLIADATRTKLIALYNYALLGYEDCTGSFVADPNAADQNKPIIINHEAGPGRDETCACATEAVIKRDSVNHRTTYEIQLPMAALGLASLGDGPKFGLGMAINDGDGYLNPDTSRQYGQAGQQGQKGWGGWGAHALVFGKSPTQTGLVTPAGSPDLDNDGLPSSYEQEHGLNPYNSSDALLDKDGDGFTNLDEFLAGTNPGIPGDALSVLSSEADETARWLTFNSVLGRVYRAEQTDVSPQGPWNPIGAPVLGDGTQKTVLVPTSGAKAPRFYRIVLLQDVTRPGDLIVATAENSHESERAENAIDDTPRKYYNRDKLNAGFTVRPSIGVTIVGGLILMSANDDPSRDPASYRLEGSTDGTIFTEISSGSIAAFTRRYERQILLFDNRASYVHYRLIIPAVANPQMAGGMQIAEVELLGVLTPPTD